jgi:hypothetical protein
MGLLCRLGLHSWKQRMFKRRYRDGSTGWQIVGKQCRRCRAQARCLTSSNNMQPLPKMR